MLAIEPIYVFLRMANLPSAESGHLGAFVEAFLELAVTRGKNIDIWAQIRPRAWPLLNDCYDYMSLSRLENGSISL